MAESKIIAPIEAIKAPISEHGGKWSSKSGLVNMLKKINTDYGNFIDPISKMTNIPKDVIIAFIAVESGGKVDAGQAGHITQGLMQWNRSYAKKQLENELKEGRMSAGEKEILKKYGVMDSNEKIREVTNADQLKPELNILIGSILLGQLMDTAWGTTNSKDGNIIHLDRIISVYNAGAFGDTGKKARQITTPKLDTPQSLSAGVNPITRSYIAKIIGKDGALDLVRTEKIV